MNAGLFIYESDPVGIRTRDPQLRRLLLYPAELPDQTISGCKGTNKRAKKQILIRNFVILRVDYGNYRNKIAERTWY